MFKFPHLFALGSNQLVGIIQKKDEGSRLIDLIKTASLEKEDHRFQKLFDCEGNLRYWAKKSTDAHEYRAVRSHCGAKVRLASLE